MALSSLGVFLVEEILSGERHQKFREAVNVLLVSLRVRQTTIIDEFSFDYVNCHLLVLSFGTFKIIVQARSLKWPHSITDFWLDNIYSLGIQACDIPKHFISNWSQLTSLKQTVGCNHFSWCCFKTKPLLFKAITIQLLLLLINFDYSLTQS